MSIADFFFGRKQNSTNKLNRKSVRTRNLRLEALEERALLSVTPLSADEYSALSAQYAEFNLPENMGDLNVITLDLAEGDGLTELENAIQTAGTTTESDLIVVRTSDDANTIQYTAAEDELIIDIDSTDSGSITIVGLGSKPLTLDADQQCRIIAVSGENTIANLGGLTIANGDSEKSGLNSDRGGGIYNSGAITVAHCSVTGNTATWGGGIYSADYRTLAIFNSTISENTASTSGSGIYNDNYGTLTVTNCTIAENTTTWGGGIYNDHGTLEVANSTFLGNMASGNGGGIYNSETLTVSNCTISGNSATWGGGIYNDSSGTLTVANCLITGNTASKPGGGIYNSKTLTVTNCTISGNTATYGVGICNCNGKDATEAATTTVNNSLVIDSILKQSGIVSGSYNISPFVGWTSGSGNIAYDSAKPLFVNAANGDYHLIAGSQAIDKGSNTLAVNASGQALTTDFDNLTRIANGKVDIGAYEYHVQLSVPTLSVAKTGSDSVKVTVGAVTNASGYAVEYSTSSNFANAARQNVSAGETTITGLNANRTYYFRAFAVGTGDYRDSTFSASASATTDRITLTAPTLTSTVKKTTATFSWDEDPNASGYQFEYKAAGTEDWTVENVDGTSFSFEGDRDTTYTARVMALGEGDFVNSAYSAELDAYVNGAQVAINGKKITVDWIDDSAAADSIRYRVAGTTKWTTKKLKAGVTTFTFNGKVGSDYEIEVLLDQQEVKTYNTTAVVLDQPKLKADKAALKDDTFQVSVTNYAAKNLADNATQAIVTVNGVQTTLDIENQEGSAELENGGFVAFNNGLFTFTEMNSNTSYKVQVAFSDGLSVSTASSALTVKTTKAPYLAPAITSATALSDTCIVVEWETAYGKGTETPAQKYTVQYSLDGNKWTNATTAATGNFYTIQKLKGGNEYQVRVLATKDNTFLASDPSEILTAETLALPKHTLDKTTLTDDSFTVNVSNYRTTNLPKATVVNVKSDKFGETAINLVDGAGSATFGDTDVTVVFENGDLTFANVPSNTQQKIQVNFSDGVCTTAWSAVLTVKTTMAPYIKPTLTNAEAVSSTSVVVEWEPTVGKGTETLAQKYTVQYSLDGNKWTNATTSATGTSFTITKLKPNTKYLVAVFANKDSNFLASEPSNSQEVTTL